MIANDISERFKLMPKIELHVHVEGALSAETYYELALKNNVKLPVASKDEWLEFYRFQNFSHFIEVYISSVRLIKYASDFTWIIESFYKHQKSQNIIYTEAFISASFLVEKFNTDEILDAIAIGIKNGEEQHGIQINFIPDIARNVPETQAQVTDFVIKGFDRGIFIGMGLDGLEIGFPPELFIDSFNKAKSHGLNLVAHAGEAVGPDSIWGALKFLNAQRIGHGINCVKDEALMEYLSTHKVPVEVSPSSNYCLQVINANEPHPIRKMVDLGVFCTLNSDDPGMFNTSLSNEYSLLYNQGFSFEELWNLNLNAIEASFLNMEDKQKIKERLNTYWESLT